jgi:hypothetical protein
MGAAALSPSSWEQRTLSYIAGELAASNLNLASTLAAFNRLTWGEEMPARQHADGSGESLVARAEAAAAPGSAATCTRQSRWRGLP